MPKVVVRGMQLGLGITLAGIALNLVGKEGASGYVLAGVCVVALRLQHRVPGPLVVIGLGIAYALLLRTNAWHPATWFGVGRPVLVVPYWAWCSCSRRCR